MMCSDKSIRVHEPLSNRKVDPLGLVMVGWGRTMEFMVRDRNPSTLTWGTPACASMRGQVGPTSGTSCRDWAPARPLDRIK
jgi:hypothetical protein